MKFILLKNVSDELEFNLDPKDNIAMTDENFHQLKKLFANKPWVNEFIGIYVDDDIKATLQFKDGNWSGGNIGIIRQLPDKSRYIIRGYMVSAELLANLVKNETYDSESLIKIGKFIADLSIGERAATFPHKLAEINSVCKAAKAPKGWSQMRFVVPQYYTGGNAQSHIPQGTMLIKEVKFKSMVDPTDYTAENSELKMCKLTFFHPLLAIQWSLNAAGQANPNAAAESSPNSLQQ